MPYGTMADACEGVSIRRTHRFSFEVGSMTSENRQVRGFSFSQSHCCVSSIRLRIRSALHPSKPKQYAVIPDVVVALKK
jgi:hypothetical protein